MKHGRRTSRLSASRDGSAASRRDVAILDRWRSSHASSCCCVGATITR